MKACNKQISLSIYLIIFSIGLWNRHSDALFACFVRSNSPEPEEDIQLLYMSMKKLKTRDCLGFLPEEWLKWLSIIKTVAD